MRALTTCIILAGAALNLFGQDPEPEKFAIKMERREGQTAVVDIDTQVDGHFQEWGTDGKKSKLKKRIDLRFADIIDKVEGGDVDRLQARRRYLNFKREEEGLKTDPEQAGATFNYVLNTGGADFEDHPELRHSAACIAIERWRGESLAFTSSSIGTYAIGDSVVFSLNSLLSLILGLDCRTAVTALDLTLKAFDDETGEFEVSGTLALQYQDSFGARQLTWTWELEIEIEASSTLGQFTKIEFDGTAKIRGEVRDRGCSGEAKVKAKAVLKPVPNFERIFNSRWSERDVTRAIETPTVLIDLPSSWHLLSNTSKDKTVYCNTRTADGDHCKVTIGTAEAVILITDTDVQFLIPEFGDVLTMKLKQCKSGLGRGISCATPVPPFFVYDAYPMPVDKLGRPGLNNGLATLGFSCDEDSLTGAKRHVRSIRKSFRFDG